MELAEGLPSHEIGGADGQPAVLCRSSAAPTPRASPTPRRRRSALKGMGSLRRMQSHACSRSPLFERPSLGRRVGRRAQLQLGVKRGHQREELRQLLVGAGPEVVDHAGQARGLSGPQLICRHFSPDLQRTRRQRWL